MLLDDQGWLRPEPDGAQITHLPTVRTSPLAGPRPLALVWHATGGVGGPRFAESLARRIQTYRRGVDRPASWHICCARSGAIYQSAPLTVATWHVRRPGVIAGVRHPRINAVTIGVELENAGPLVRCRGEYYAWPYWRDPARRQPDPRWRIDAGRVVLFEGRPYHGFTAQQVASARELAEALVKSWGWGAEPLSYCHGNFAAPRKTDPGALWMKKELPAILAAIFPPAGTSGAPVAGEVVVS